MLLRHVLGLTFIASTLMLTACNNEEKAPAQSVNPPTIKAAEEITTEETSSSEKPMLFSSIAVSTTVLIEAIDYKTRVVTFITEHGGPITTTVDEDAHNLDQIKVGDKINVDYVESISIEVVAAEEGSEPAVAELAAIARAEKGEQPAVGTIESQMVVTIVEEINLENNTFKLKEPDGEIREYTARNPENLKLADVGDAVIITTVEAVSFSLADQPTDSNSQPADDSKEMAPY